MRPVPLYPFPSRARQAITSFDILVVSNVSSVFGFANVIIGIWFAVRTSARHSSRSTFDPPPAYVTILIYCIPTPYTLFSSVSRSSLSFSSTISQSIPRQLHISPSRSAYHHHIPIPIFLRDFLAFSLRSSQSLRSSLPLFLETNHSLYLANLHLFSSRSTYHHDIPMPIFLRVFGFSFRLYFWLLRILSSFLSSTV